MDELPIDYPIEEESLSFVWNNKNITAYAFEIGGSPMVGLSCETLYEVAITQELGLIDRYPFIDFEEFKEALVMAGLIEDYPYDEVIISGVNLSGGVE
jgi:hypothetical protein